MIKIEVWAGDYDDNHNPYDITITTEDNHSAKKTLLPGSKLIHSFEATDWNEGMTKAYELLGWEPYKPIEDL